MSHNSDALDLFDIISSPSDFIDKITCDKVSRDGFSAENLLENRHSGCDGKSVIISTSKNSKGFMADRFVMPPVILNYYFRRPINLEAIFLGLKMGDQRTTGLEIYVNNSYENVCDEIQIQRRVACAYFSHSTARPSPEKCLVSRKNALCERYFSENFTPEQKNASTVHFTRCYLLDNVRNLIIKITRAHYVPCLEFLKIYIKTPKNLLISDGNRIISEEIVKEKISPKNSLEIAKNYEAPSTAVEVPSEFFDPLTNLCMSLPVLLPSGHTIDRSTLEKYCEQEAKYGRSPNDPFTGVRFSDNSRPKPNSQLKERMDKFFINFPHFASRHDVGRTICGGNYSAVSSVKRVRNVFSDVHKPDESVADEEPLRKKAKNLELQKETQPVYVTNVLTNLPSFL